MNHLHFARAPVRVDLAGGGCDAPPYCTDFGGTVVNIAVAHHVYAALRVTGHGARVASSTCRASSPSSSRTLCWPT